MSRPEAGEDPPVFTASFRETLRSLIEWRRDVRSFLTAPVDPGLIDEIIAQAVLSPSVGHSQPWRWVLVEDGSCRARIRNNFSRCNSDALHAYQGERAKLYATLKLSGLDRAPVQIAVFCDTEAAEGHGLGRRTMPEALCHSVAGAVLTFQLVARAHGIGVGVVTILDPDEARQSLDVPAHWRLVAYLCVGYPEQESKTPELVRLGWQERVDVASVVFKR